jgi:hypothetical protein
MDDKHINRNATAVAQKTVWDQWPEGQGPAMIQFDPIEWKLTRDPAEVEAFQPAHDCEQCREGNEKAKRFLEEYPDRWVLLGNIHYVEMWPDPN